MPTQINREQLSVQRERAILAAGLLPDDGRDPQDPLGELRSLADTAGAVVVDELMQKRQKPNASTFVGKGKVEALRDMASALKADVIIFDNDLSPSQIGNIEKIVERKVLDRSELILDIFAARARTHEAKLQVELAQLEYTYPRLRAMWTHLERIVGGAPAGIGTRGPGEQQLEIDRRIVQRKKSELKKEITQIQGRKEREVAARNLDYFTVGLVGYTNAGKSTLFNTLTEGEAYADDKLFATLSTRTRKWNLGGGDTAMLSDTVGFVRDLPHHLVASFRATLEEAVHSDLLLVVLDVAHPRAKQQLETVMEVLDEIGADAQPRLLVLNKIDAIEHASDIDAFQSEHHDSIAISAKTGRGLDQLVERVREAVRGQLDQLDITMHTGDGKAINFLENRASVINRRYEGDDVTMSVRIGARQLDQLRAMGTTARLAGAPQNAGLPGDGPTRGWGR
ncbi:GTPase HflX [Phycisphaerales bacterium AB-hyl4]|uniref:GTPase HflX n=1 Tax=Natronomicrosphaera hydrolytica TaxID=3242702 RepID=A0ABV4U9K4_9BACT